MASFLCKTKNDSEPKGKPRVYFTCHPADFDRCFGRILEDIFKVQDCAVYYTADMSEVLEEENLATDLGQMSLFVVPVTYSLLTTPNRAMDVDLAFAQEAQIPILPLMMEPKLDELYSQEDKFGQRQYLNPISTDLTEIRYEDKLRKYLESTLISDEMARRIRAAFDAYIFLSYRKKDRRYANELMRLIHNNEECRDIAIWYDEFLAPGESFAQSIRKALTDSKLFALLVTPSLLEDSDGKPNFVMATEYPEAQKAGKNILPAEMEPTDHQALAEKFLQIPECVNPRETDTFHDHLIQAIEKVAIITNNTDPEHNFLIGLAYMEGIDVEVDRLRGIELITSAAKAGLPEAMKRLMKLYGQGQYVPKDQDIAIHWGQKLLHFYAATQGEDRQEALEILEYLGGMHRHEKAIEYYEKAYALHINKHHQDTPWSEQLLGKLAGRYDFVDKQRAIEVKNQQYAACLELYGHQDIHTISVLSKVAKCYYNAKEYDQAAFTYAQVRELERQVGRSKSVSLSTTNNLALSYLNAGRMSLALELLIEVCRESESAYPEDYKTRSIHWGNLGYVYDKLGDSHKAITCYEKSHFILCDTPKKDQQYRLDVKDSRQSVLKLHEKYGAHGATVAFLEKELDRLQNDTAVDVTETIDALEAAAEAYRKLEQTDKELHILQKLYAEAFDLFVNNPGKMPFVDWLLKETLDKMAAACNTLGDTDRANFYREKDQVNVWLKTIDEIRDPFGWTITTLGKFYAECGDRSRALQMAEESYIETVNTHGPAHKDSLDALLHLTCGFRVVKNHPKTLEYLTKMVDLQSYYLEDNHPNLLKNRIALAKLYREMDMPQMAAITEEQITRFMTAPKTVPDSVEELKRLLENPLIQDKEYALSLREKLYQCICRESGELSYEAFEQMQKLAYAYEDCQNYPKALELIQKAHDMATAVLGENYQLSASFNVDSNLGQIARLYWLCGNLTEWVKTAEFRYHRIHETHGEDLTATYSALCVLARAYEQTNRLQEAAKLLEYAMTLEKKRDGKNSDHLSTFLVGIYMKQKNYNRAIPLYEQLYALRQEIYGNEHHKTLLAMGWLAYTYSEAGNIAKALTLQKEVYDLRVKVSGEESATTITALINLGAMYEQAGDNSNALLYLEKAWKHRLNTLGVDHPDTESLRQWVLSIQNQ